MTPASAVTAPAGTLGILGGTFDPIHLGHIAAAEAAQTALALDEIVLIPSHIPPHRAQPATASAEDRLAMAQLAASTRPGWSVSRIELDRHGKSYTYDTLVELRRPPRADFFHHWGRCVRRYFDMVALSGRAGPRQFRRRLATRNHVRLIT